MIGTPNETLGVRVVSGAANETPTRQLTCRVRGGTGDVSDATDNCAGEDPRSLSLRSEAPQARELIQGARAAQLGRRGLAKGLLRLLPEALGYPCLGKPLLDRIGAIILGVAFLPIVVIIAIVIRVTLGSPVLYVQERVGQGGKRFRMYKFRTMGMDRRREQRTFPGVDHRVRHKTAADPRHTRVGRFLRRRSFDELPQLWNVVLGDMSLVGPRPELPSIVARYRNWQHERHLCKPGLTGLWQVSARNNGDGSLMCEHTEVDLDYLRAVSFRTDVAILYKTLGVLGGGE